jgi:hypothetical protein
MEEIQRPFEGRWCSPKTYAAKYDVVPPAEGDYTGKSTGIQIERERSQNLSS